MICFFFIKKEIYHLNRTDIFQGLISPFSIGSVTFLDYRPIYIYNIHDMICEECADMIVDMNNLYGSLSKACITHTHTIHPAHLNSAGNLRFIHEQDNFQ